MIPLCYGHVTNFIKGNQRAKPDLRIGRLSWRSFRRCRFSGATVHRAAQGKMGVLAIWRRPVPYLRRNVPAELSIHAGGR
jgi:hypothetical protein